VVLTFRWPPATRIAFWHSKQMEVVVDLRLFGAMAFIAYVTFCFVGNALSPLARSRRASRRLRLAYARCVAVILVLSPVITFWVPNKGLLDGIQSSMLAALLPLFLLSLGFGLVASYRWWQRRQARLNQSTQDQAPVLTLDQLRERKQSRPGVAPESSPSSKADASVSKPPADTVASVSSPPSEADASAAP